MFALIGRAVTRFRWTAIALAALVVIAGISWGTGVFGSLAQGGVDAPGSESAKVKARINDELGAADVHVLAIYRSDQLTVADAAFQSEVTDIMNRLRDSDDILHVTSYYDDPNRLARLASDDKHSTYLAVSLDAESDGDRADAYERVEKLLNSDQLETQLAGPTPTFAAISERIQSDIAKAEMLALPIVFLLSLFIFGGLIAALMPMLVGIIAIMGAFLITRLLTTVTDISVFAINIITMMGLGLAIDYALFIVGRFREELAGGKSSRDAAITTVRTAGRTVAVSGFTVMLSFAGLLIFPQLFLRSMGLGGIAAVGVAVIASLTFLPALLALLGKRIDALPVRLPRRLRSNGGGWARVANFVMKRPIIVTVGTIAVLLALAIPFANISFGGVDERQLPPGSPVREASEALRNDFQRPATEINVLIDNASPEQAAAIANDLQARDDVEAAAVIREKDGLALVTVTHDGKPTSDSARDLVNELRGMQPGSGMDITVGGSTAELNDLLDSLASRLPYMVALVGLVTITLLTVAFGSILLPIKAVLMNVVSLGASFGVVVYIFQDGHLAGLLNFTPTGTIDATQPILMVAILFGLAMDYELFLLSRIREEWDATGNNELAVARGLERTGSVITAAALLLIVVVGGFATGGITMIKMIGVGMIVAIVVDATLVRLLLVPATMRLLGRWNWWLPRPMRSIVGRIKLEDHGQHPAQPALEHV